MATHTRPAARLSRVLLLALISRIAVLSFMLVSDVAFSKLDSSSSLIDFPCLPRRQETDHKEERVLAAPFSSFFSSVPSVFAPASTSASTSSPQTLRDSHSHPPSAREACSKSHACSGRMVVWDTVYFVRIAKCGYEYDLTHAFFPLMPLLMRAFASIMSFGMMGRLCEETAYAVAGILINVVAFCVAAAALYRLTWTTTRDEELAVTSVIFFCFNPASVFYSAVYTESLFTALTWVGMICLPEPFWSAVICFALASAARSNGILACWFLIHRLAVMIFQKRRRNSLWWECCRTTIGCAMICTPYVWMQSMAYDNFCRSSSLQDVGLNPHDTEYCQKTLPSMYGYVQEKYWDVGFLRFYRKLDRWPWILQSLPILLLALWACWSWSSWDWRRALTLGIVPPSAERTTMARSERHAGRKSSFQSFRSSVGAAPYVHHLVLMTVVALFFMHVNVATRFLCVNPVLYWFVAAVHLGRTTSERSKR